MRNPEREAPNLKELAQPILVVIVLAAALTLTYWKKNQIDSLFPTPISTPISEPTYTNSAPTRLQYGIPVPVISQTPTVKPLKP